MYMCMHVCLCTACMQCLWRRGKSLRFSGTGVSGSCKLPCACWESNLGLLEEQPVFVSAEPVLQSQLSAFLDGIFLLCFQMVKEQRNFPKASS